MKTQREKEYEKVLSVIMIVLTPIAFSEKTAIALMFSAFSFILHTIAFIQYKDKIRKQFWVYYIILSIIEISAVLVFGYKCMQGLGMLS